MTQRVRRHDKRIIYLLAAVFVATFSFVFLNGRFGNTEDDVDAASLANFDAGNIISDYVMGNYNSMSESDIENFLTSKNSCDNTDYDYYRALSNGSSYEWHWADGHFICLSEEKFGDGETIGSGDTAAHIIYQAAQDYKINPQVLIILLQKETGLITDPIPNNGDYRKATGYGCPDTAACSSKYYGFKNQVRHAAALFRDVLDGGWTNYPLGNNYIQYNPNSGCGGSTVNIQNLATSALYRYTPYQPNSGALEAGYGTAYCGSYGNRNFYLYFNDWFGSTTKEYSEKLGRAIPDGIYQLISEKYQDKSFDIKGGITEESESGRVILFEAREEDNKNQIFEIKYDSAINYYKIINPLSGLYLEMVDDELGLHSKNTQCSQNWNIKRVDSSIIITSACSGHAIDATASGNLIIFEEHGGINQQWRLQEMSGTTHKIKDGLYQITSKLDDAFTLDIKGGVTRNTTSGKMEIWTKRNLNYNIENQIFNLKYNNDTGYYSIINPLTGLSLDVRGGGKEDGTEIIMWQYNDTYNQQWMIRQNQDGYFDIISAASGKVLDIRGGEAINGKEILLWSSHGGNNQHWSFEPIDKDSELESGLYQIGTSLSSQFVLDIAGGVSSDTQEGKAIIFTNNKTLNQKFELVYNKNLGYYKIKNPTSNLYLDIIDQGTNNSARVIFSKESNECSQQWNIKHHDDGGYIVQSLCSDKVLDISGGVAENSHPIIIFNEHDGDNQRWTFINAL